MGGGGGGRAEGGEGGLGLPDPDTSPLALLGEVVVIA